MRLDERVIADMIYHTIFLLLLPVAEPVEGM